jgi:NAD(P)H-hydrate epimerase
MKVTTVEEMRELDRRAIKEFGISDELLMENAGLASFQVIEDEIGVPGIRFLVLCGGGNNGGDGFVVARKLYSGGGVVEVFVLGDEKKYSGAAKKNYEIATKLGFPIKKLESLEELQDALNRCEVVVDALFGTGLDRPVEGLYQEVIQRVNAADKVVVSLDIPSGINGNNGLEMGEAIWADYTITFGLPKLGNLLYPGYSHGGFLFVTHISFPPQLTGQESIKTEINLPPYLPERPEDGHKGAFGDVLFIAGASSYFGAPYFAARSLLKAGGGYARLASIPSVCQVVATKGSEIVFIPLKETSAGSIALANLEKLLELAEQVDLVVIGPGLSLHSETQELVRALVRRVSKPVLIDGDGLTALAIEIQTLPLRENPTILTPHLGEMSRLVEMPITYIKKHRIDVLRQAAQEWQAFIVLKGAHSLIGYPDGRVFINLSGNSGMASAGSGDVLTGTIAAAYGQGLEVGEAVRTGVFLHGLAGDLAAEERGLDGITAEDILEYLPAAVDIFRERYAEILEDYYGSVFIL